VADEAELAPVLALSSHFGLLLDLVTPPLAQPQYIRVVSRRSISDGLKVYRIYRYVSSYVYVLIPRGHAQPSNPQRV
jgi:hypothetical protein